MRDPTVKLTKAVDLDVDASVRDGFEEHRLPHGAKPLVGYIPLQELYQNSAHVGSALVDEIGERGFTSDGAEARSKWPRVHVGNICDAVKSDKILSFSYSAPTARDYDRTKGGSPVKSPAKFSTSPKKGASSSGADSATKAVAAIASHVEEPEDKDDWFPRGILRVDLCVKKPFVTYDEAFFLMNEIPADYDSMVSCS